MKIKILVICLLAAVMTNCENLTISASEEAIITSNDWSVIYFWDKDSDETSDFNGYSFRFETDGAFIATKNNEDFIGTWSIRNDDSRKKLIINLTGNGVLDEINEDWTVVTISNTRIELKDDNGVKEEILHFGN